MHPVASKSLKDWAQCLRQLNFKNRLLPTGITINAREPQGSLAHASL